MIRVAGFFLLLSLVGFLAAALWSRSVDGVWLWQPHRERVPADGPMVLAGCSLIALLISAGFGIKAGLDWGSSHALGSHETTSGRLLGLLVFGGLLAALVLLRLLFP